MSKIEYRTFKATARVVEHPETRSTTGGSKQTVQGTAIVFNSDSEDMGFIERIAPTALDRSLEAATNEGWNIVFLWEHKGSEPPLGSTRGGKLKLSKTAEGLAFDLDPARMSFAQLDAIRDGDMQMSFGFSVEPEDQTVVTRSDGTQLRTIHNMTLYEISAVLSPAYSATHVGTRAAPDLAPIVTDDAAPSPADAVTEVAAEAINENEVEKASSDRRAKLIDNIDRHITLLAQRK